MTRQYFDDFLTTMYDANRIRQDLYPGAEAIKDDLTFRGSELAEEVGEFIGCLKKIRREQLGMAGRKIDRHELMEECGDVVSAFLLACITAGLEPEDIMNAAAMKFNDVSKERNLPVFINAGGQIVNTEGVPFLAPR